jgi:hypothetical protein
MFDSGVLQQHKIYGYNYRIKKGNTVMLECDAKEKNIYFFIDGKFVTICLN